MENEQGGAMSLIGIKKAKAWKPPLAVFFGVAGVGKTSLAASFPAPVFLRTAGEDYPTGIEVDEFDQASAFSDVITAIGTLANEDHAFETFVLDSVDGLESLVWAETCLRNGWGTIEDAGFGKGYVAALAPWREILDGLQFLRVEKRMSIVLLAHTEITRFDSPTSDPYSRYRINLHKRSADLIENAADLIGFLNYRATIKQVDAGFNKKVAHAEGGGARVIYTEERPGFIAKNRFGIPPEINYKLGEGYKALAKYFPQAA